ncbi:MAG: glycosyltransferase family 2 protein [Polaribacter sp.]|nr:glycosyltransferase family 2 protein [Polaribacter sp.]
MENKLDITASIVLYKEDATELKKTVECFLNTKMSKKLYLIDNTPSKIFKNSFNQPEIEYFGIGENIGFGAAHNKVLCQLEKGSKFHLILNPDVIFSPETIPNLIEQLKRDGKTSMIAPKVLFPNGEHQYSCRRYPTLIELLIRRIPILRPWFKEVIDRGIYKDKDLDTPFFAEYLTGCFQLYKTLDFVSLKGFDERYFLYMEDVDICKKIDVSGKKKMYYPNQEITHILKQGSSKKVNLFFRHLFSSIKYFKKWGF